ncbi:MAG: hypothetical protein M2R45_04375 [Verrucomicrobia subdivision 3 bacterium]|nr:hypothetical protein [Limisphaerales bacterium]MCS1416080.1 hypothetical protein [Limisphaerales bacterium]
MIGLKDKNVWNGSVPADDAVGIALRMVMRALLPEEAFPNKTFAFTGGELVTAAMFDDSFPCLTGPVKGSSNDPSITLIVESSPGADGAFRPAAALFDAVTQALTTGRGRGVDCLLSITSRPCGHFDQFDFGR